MADVKITALAVLTAADPINDAIPIVDVSDISMAASGTTKRISVNNILSSSPTASGALTVTGLVTAGSATITGDLTVDTNVLKVDTTNNRVGIGTASPTGIFHAANLGTAGTTADNFNGYFSSANRNSSVYILAKNTEGSNLYFGDGDSNTVGAVIYDHTSNYMKFDTNASERMRIDSSGNLLVARTSAGLSNGTGVTIGQSSIGMQTEGNATQIAMNRTTSDGTIVDIRRNNVTVGTIAVTTTATAYNTSSDYRLKEAAQPLVRGLARVNALKRSVYKWKANGSAGEGFIAHELAEVVPLAVTGDKDAVDADGKPAYQGVDLSKIVPILVAAIQELTAEVNALKNA
jgi:hypothetical protein